ncbi:MAG: FAD-binding oxidoreductase [Bdellovibrionaceae bacterium]|nr:FAD-binding oxidoreductase [Pseudobdellovibrionaceae bacterium]
MSSPRSITKFTVERIVDHTPNIRELYLLLKDPGTFSFKAGQFVMLHVPQSEGKPVLRAYSIASEEQNEKGLRLIFKYVPDGKASTYVWSLRGGEELQFTGPFGKVLFQEPPTRQIVFLNTGSGVSQHLCYLLSKKNKYPHLTYRMLFGVRSEQDIYLRDELEKLTHELHDFHFEYVLSRPSPEWRGKRGYVQDFISDFDYLTIPTTFYLCGNGAMIKDVKSLLESQGFDKSRIWTEAFD